MKKSIILAAIAAVVLTGCKDSFLDRQYQGEDISQEKFERLGSETLEGTLLGLYTMIYSDGSSSHDVFGQRSIDLWGDILCGDIAVTNKTYGWLYRDEQMLTATGRTGYVWGFYYDLIHNANAVIETIYSNKEFTGRIEQYGLPSANDTAYKYFEANDTTYAVYLAQALSLRAYCYANIFRWYTPVNYYPVGTSSFMTGQDITTYQCAPVYNETNYTKPQALSTSEQVFQQVYKDFSDAIMYFDAFGGYDRTSKLQIDEYVARGLFAYALINAVPYYRELDNAKYTAYNTLALQLADSVITSGEFQMINRQNLTETGFNDASNPSWMWGQTVVTETAGGLKSWFGQVDIHSYSYAWAGDTKVIDENLLVSLKDGHPWDARVLWFNDGETKSAFKDCPDGKFFSNKNRYSTAAEDIDREWLSDNVLMRFESMYLIAAEAAMNLDQIAKAKEYLTTLTAERVLDDDSETINKYNDFVNSLSSADKFRTELTYNWRVEMWGEGFGLQTFRRLTGTTKRGGNHDYAGGQEVNATDASFNMQIPTAEATYNPYVGDDNRNKIVKFTKLTKAY